MYLNCNITSDVHCTELGTQSLTHVYFLKGSFLHRRFGYVIKISQHLFFILLCFLQVIQQ
jgi:hypothetical protein